MKPRAASSKSVRSPNGSAARRERLWAQVMGAAPLLMLVSPAMVGDPSLIGPFASGETRAVLWLGRIGPAIASIAELPSLGLRCQPVAMPARLVPALPPWPAAATQAALRPMMAVIGAPAGRQSAPFQRAQVRLS